ncbi:serine/threonine-protein kinase [Myxococcota bacterium]
MRDYDGTPLKVVHRDVSPHNTFVTYDGLVKVLDFGIAKAANAPSHTKTGIVKGKLSYMAPEQLVGESLDRRADIFAVGCMLWRAATGLPLWSGMTEREIIRGLVDGRVPRPSLRRSVDSRLEQIVMKALAPEPMGRHATALELQSELEQYLVAVNSQCTMRDVAGFVSGVFAEERSKRAKTIHSSLSLGAALPVAESDVHEVQDARGQGGSYMRAMPKSHRPTAQFFGSRTQSRRAWRWGGDRIGRVDSGRRDCAAG